MKSPTHRGLLRCALLIATALYVLLLVPIYHAASRVPTILEGNSSAGLVGFASLFVSLPIAMVIALAVAWLAYARHRNGLAWLAVAVRPLWALLTLALMAL